MRFGSTFVTRRGGGFSENILWVSRDVKQCEKGVQMNL